MTIRLAACQCGQLTAEARGEPVRVSACHCLSCQRRSGSAFAAQARFQMEDVTITGTYREWTRIADTGRWLRQRFCPHCGSTIAYENEGPEGLIAIPIGLFANPNFPPARFSVYEERKHSWVEITGDVEHD